MKNLKLLLSLFVVVFLGACGNAKKPLECFPPVVKIKEQGKCNLGKKSGGVTLATKAECQEMGGIFVK